MLSLLYSPVGTLIFNIVGISPTGSFQKKIANLDLMDSSRELSFICVISFIINLYLLLIVSIQISNMTWTKV